MNEAGLVFWILVGASICCAVIAVGLLGAVVRAHRPEDFD
jgi:hypothetical protein